MSWLRMLWFLIRVVVSVLLNVVCHVPPGRWSILGDRFINPRGSAENHGPGRRGGKSTGLKSHPTASDFGDTRKNGGKTA